MSLAALLSTLLIFTSCHQTPGEFANSVIKENIDPHHNPPTHREWHDGQMRKQ